MTIADQILQLELHAENLKACRSFEDYQRCHVAWIDLLVLEHKAKLANEQAVQEFVDKTEFVTKIKDAAGKITETTVKTQWQVAAGRPEDAPDELMPPEPPAHADDAETYDPVRAARAKRRGPVVHTSSAMSNACDQEEGA